MVDGSNVMPLLLVLPVLPRRWLLDSGNVMQPLGTEENLEEEAERELMSTAGTAYRALQHAAADTSLPAVGASSGTGGATGELAQLQSVLGLLFGSQVSNEASFLPNVSFEPPHPYTY